MRNLRGMLPCPARLALVSLLGLALLAALSTNVPAAGPVVQGKAWPVGYFLKYQKISPAQRQEVFRDIAAKLRDLNEARESLVVKGTVIGSLGPEQKVYDKLTVLDESGLKVVVRRVPNIYYGFYGPPKLINPNVYLLIRRVKLKETDSLIEEGFVVEGDYHGFAHAYITAIQQSLERALQGDLK